MSIETTMNRMDVLADILVDVVSCVIGFPVVAVAGVLFVLLLAVVAVPFAGLYALVWLINLPLKFLFGVDLFYHIDTRVEDSKSR